MCVSQRADIYIKRELMNYDLFKSIFKALKKKKKKKVPIMFQEDSIPIYLHYGVVLSPFMIQLMHQTPP